MSAPVLTVSLRGDRDAPVLVLLGELDLAGVALLEEHTAALTAGTHVVVGLERLDFLDVAGLNALLALHHRLAPGGLALRGPSRTVLRMLTLLGLTSTLPVLAHRDGLTARDECASS